MWKNAAEPLLERISTAGLGVKKPLRQLITVDAWQTPSGRAAVLHSFHMLSTGDVSAYLGHVVEKALRKAIHALRVSCSLLSSLFKSLSALRAVSIFSMECRTVVWCLPPN